MRYSVVAKRFQELQIDILNQSVTVKIADL